MKSNNCLYCHVHLCITYTYTSDVALGAREAFWVGVLRALHKSTTVVMIKVETDDVFHLPHAESSLP